MKILNWSFFESQSAPGSHSRFRALQTLLWSILSIGAVLILSGQLSAAPPAPDIKADLVLFDFGDAKDKQIREAAIAVFQLFAAGKIAMTGGAIGPCSSSPRIISKIVETGSNRV